MPDEEEILPDDENSIVGESSHYSKKAGFDKGAVTQKQVEKCLDARAEDLSRPGYTTWITDKKGETHPQIIPDFRKKFIGSVEGLKQVMLPEILKDKNAKEILKDFEDAVEEVYNKYVYHERLYKVEVLSPDGNHYNDKSKWVYSKNVFMPELGAKVLMDDVEAPNSTSCIFVPGGWDINHNAYYSELVEIYNWLFGELNILIDTNNYFKAGSSW